MLVVVRTDAVTVSSVRCAGHVHASGGLNFRCSASAIHFAACGREQQLPKLKSLVPACGRHFGGMAGREYLVTLGWIGADGTIVRSNKDVSELAAVCRPLLGRLVPLP